MLRKEGIELYNLPEHHDDKQGERSADRVAIISMDPVHSAPRFGRKLKQAAFELFLSRVDLEHAFPAVAAELEELTDNHAQPDSAAVADYDVEDPVIPPAFLKIF